MPRLVPNLGGGGVGGGVGGSLPGGGGGGGLAFVQEIGGASASSADIEIAAASGTTTGNMVMVNVLLSSSANNAVVTDDGGNTYVSLQTYDIGMVSDNGVRRLVQFAGIQATGLTAGQKIYVASDGMPINLVGHALEFSGVNSVGSGFIEGDAAFDTGDEVDGSVTLGSGESGDVLYVVAVAHQTVARGFSADAEYTTTTPISLVSFGKLRVIWFIDSATAGTSYGDLSASDDWLLLAAAYGPA